MSRTDKDKPWPLRAAEQQPGAYFRHLCGGYWSRPCDADADPYEAFKNAYNRKANHTYVSKTPSCSWTLPHASLSHPPAWYIQHVWSNAERVRERSKLGEMAKEYNANGYLEDEDFPCWQHRHMAHWLYW